MRNLIVCTFFLLFALQSFDCPAYAQMEQSQKAADKEQSHATGYEQKSVLILSAPTAYNKLTAQQKERMDRVLTLLKLSPEDRPRASERLKNEPSMAVGKALQSNAQVKDIDCVLDEHSAGCWFDDTYCGIIWAEGSSRPAAEVVDVIQGEQELEIGCW